MSDPSAVDSRLRRLHHDDNVVVVVTAVAAGDRYGVGDTWIVAGAEMRLGDKVAGAAIEAGESVRKFGEVIGTATRAIPLGALVHVHNLRSNYIDAVVNRSTIPGSPA